MKKTLLTACIIACYTINAQSAGEMISFEKKEDLTPSFLAKHFVGELIGQPKLGEALGGLIKLIDQSNYKLEAYKVLYWTPDYNGKLVKASGLVMFPKTNYKLSTLVYCHGTTNKVEVPSNLSDSGKVGFILPTLFAVSEYIVVAPDYLGQGDSEGYHPYMNAKTEATATLDMTKAANQLLEQLGTARYDEYFLTGYSQGAHAAMAALKANNLTYKNFKFKYASLGGGPYDMSDTTLNKGVLEQPSYSISIIANIINGCHTIGYKQYDTSYKEIIAPAYQDLYQANIINNPDAVSLTWGPTIWRDLFNPAYVSKMENDLNHPLRRCVQESDVYDWYNKTPIYMSNNKVDNLIPYQNTDKTKAVMRSKFSNIFTAYLTIQGTVFNMDFGLPTIANHVAGAVPYTLASSLIFAASRKGGFLNGTAKNESVAGKMVNTVPIVNYAWTGSPMDPKLTIFESTNSRIKIDGGTESIERKSSERENNETIDLKTLGTGPHFIEITTEENKKWTIPYINLTPEEIPASSVIKTSGVNEIAIDLHALPDLKRVNLYNEQKQLVNSFENSQIKNGELVIDTQKLTPQTYIFEFVQSPVSSLITQYKKTSDVLTKTSQLLIADTETGIIIKADKILEKAEIYDMNNRLIWNSEHINSNKAVSSSIGNKGVYVVKVAYEDGTTETKKILKK